MLKLIASFIFGAVCAAAVGWFVVYQVAREKYEFGHDQGYLNAQIDIARKIPEMLGDDHHRGEPATNFYSVKDIDVLVVTRNDVKTLRLYRDQ